MSLIVHSAESLGRPFLLVDERLTEFGSSQQIALSNPHFKIVAFLETETELSIDGGAAMPIGSGDVLVVPMRCDQVYSAPEGIRKCGYRIFRIVFDPAALPPLDGRKGGVSTRKAGTEFEQFVRQTFPGVTHLPGCLDPALLDTIRRMREEADEKPLGYRHRITGLCYEFVTELARRLLPTEPEAGAPGLSRSRQIVDQARYFLMEHLAEPLTLDQIAWELKLSHVHLARVFKQATGQTVFQHLGQMRIERAKTLLDSTPLEAADIARRTGFSSPTLFGRTFKSLTGMTPGSYRARAATTLKSYKSPVHER